MKAELKEKKDAMNAEIQQKTMKTNMKKQTNSSLKMDNMSKINNSTSKKDKNKENKENKVAISKDRKSNNQTLMLTSVSLT